MGSKGQIFKFCNDTVSCQYFTEILHADKGTIVIKHIKQDLSLKACGDLGSDRVQNSLVSEYGHVAYQIKGNDSCSNITATF